MKIARVRLFKGLNSSFIFHHEEKDFSSWHNHPEFELVLITKGEGKRLVGDSIDRFEKGDLVFLGSFLPHEWRCDKKYFEPNGDFKGEGLVIQFLPEFIGHDFFNIPENKNLNNFLNNSSQGCLLYGNTKKKISSKMKKMLKMDETSRLYCLFSIFKILSYTSEYRMLSTSAFVKPYHSDNMVPIKNALEYIMLNFQNDININDLLEITNMSNTTFFKHFKRATQLSFKNYLIKLRIGYSCKLLADESLNITQIAYESGFENISNFNRRFKTIKDMTPREYRKKILL